MSAQIDSILDSYVNAANQNKKKNASQNNDGSVSTFSNMLKEKLTGSVTFNRLEKQLSVPETGKSSPDDFGYRDSRPAERPERERDRDSVEAVAAPTRQDDTPQRSASESSSAARDSAGDKAAAPAENSAAKQNNSGKEGQAGNQNTNTNAAHNQAKVAKQAEQAAGADLTAGKGQAKVQNVAETDFATVNTDAKKTNTGIKATVTTQAAQVTSQPTNSLASSANVKAEIAQQTNAAQTGQQNLAGQQDGDPAKGTAFEQLAQASDAGKQKKAKAGAAGVDASKAAADKATQNSQQLAANFNNTVAAAQSNTAAAAAKTSMPGNTGQVVTTDAVTGGTSVMGQNGSLQRTSAPTSQVRNGPNVPPKVIADQVAVNIQRAAGAGQDQINIQLRPQELGRIDVKMEMGQDGRMTAVISAEKPETLDMLRNDSRSLIQSLNDAGLQTDSNSLSFNLKGQNGEGQQQTAGGSGGKDDGEESGFSLDDAGDLDAAEPMLAMGENAVADENGRMNIRV